MTEVKGSVVVRESKQGADGSIVKAMQDYVNKLVAVPGMKALIMDKETTSIISLVYSMSDIINKEVFLIERLESSVKTDEKKQSMHHLKAVVFIRPTGKNMEQLKALLRTPRFKEFHIFFSNILPPDFLKPLAEADEFDLVRQVQEYYADVMALHDNLYELGLPLSTPLYKKLPDYTNRDNQLYERNLAGMLSALLALKKRPVIRYANHSELAKRLAFDAQKRMKDEASLFHFGPAAAQNPPLLLIVDRRDDPVTPLLTQWTYRAMSHELLTIESNRVDMSDVPGVRADQKEVVMSPIQDSFYRGQLLKNFGDLGTAVKDYVQEYQRQTKNNTKLETIDDMRRFVEAFPEFRALSGNVSKHVAVVTELSRQIDMRNLLDVSKLEQEIACNGDHAPILDNMLKFLDDAKVNWNDKLRLVMLYAIRFEDSQQNNIEMFVKLLRDRANDEQKHKSRAVTEVLAVAGSRQRGGDLFGTKTFFGRVSKSLSSLKGVENIYTQHQPFLMELLDQLVKQKLPRTGYPFVESGGGGKDKFPQVFVYMVGGITYEEALFVSQLEQSGGDAPRIILGGSHVHNSTSFIDDILGGGEAGERRSGAGEVTVDLR